jgi:hypothetical protein
MYCCKIILIAAVKYKILEVDRQFSKIAYTWGWLNTNKLDECNIQIDLVLKQYIKIRKSECCMLIKICFFILTTFNKYLNSKSQHSFM